MKKFYAKHYFNYYCVNFLTTCYKPNFSEEIGLIGKLISGSQHIIQYYLVFFLIICSSLGNIYAQSSDSGLPPKANANIPTLNFKDADIRDVLRSIAYEYETNVMIENQVNKKISVALFNVTVFNAVKIIAEDNGFEFSYDSQRFFVKIPKEKPQPVAVEPEPEVTFKRGKLGVKLANVDIQKFVDALRSATKKNYLITNGATGRVTGTLNNIDLETGLKNILQNNGFYLTVKDSIYYISRSSYFSSLDSNNDQNSPHSPYWVSAQGGRVTLDVTQAPLYRIINDLSNQLNLQVVKLTNPETAVTVKCSDVPISQALDYIFRGTKFSFKEDHGAYIIGDKDSKTLDNTKLFKLQYLRADKVKEQLPPTLAKDVSATVSIEHNALVLNGPNESINNLEDYLTSIDQPVPQVMIEALVVDYNLDNVYQYGISAGRGDSTEINRADKWYPGFNVTASGKKINKLLNDVGTINLFGKDFDMAKLGKLPNDFYVNIRALEQNGIANVRSRPILSTLNGHTASLKIGTVQNYVFDEIMPIQSTVSTSYIQKETIQKIEANISFEVTPWVGPNDELTLEIKPDFETPVGEFSPDKKLIPAINTRSLSSTVRLKDGETIVLGGLIQESESNSEDKVPLLGDIPIIGSLFSSVNKKKTKGELLIYLTPKISYGDDFGSLYYNYSK